MTSARILLPVALAAALCGCAAVGPDYAGAPAVADPAVHAARLARDASTGTPAAPASADWWRALDDATLTDLVDTALRASPTLHAAEARLRSARAALGKQQANDMPKVAGSALGAGVWQAPGTDSESTIHLYSAGFDATWELDLFGGTRRATEAASAQAQAVQADLADTQVSLAAEVAQAYLALRAQQRQQALLRETATLDTQALDLAKQRRARGVASDDEIEQRVAQAEATQASLADVASQIAVSLDRLALLTAQAPGALDARLATSPATLPALPREVAIGDASALLQRRPDIRAAERRLAQRTAQIGQQKANYFPKLQLLGDIGFAGTDLGKLFTSNGLALVGVPYLSWNAFDFGRTAAAVRGAEADRDEAVANYQSTVLGALQDANSALARFGQQRQVVQRLLTQQDSAKRSLAVVQQRRQAGVASQLDLLDAQRRDADAQRKSVDGEAELMKDFVALHKSLGLGWQAAPA